MLLRRSHPDAAVCIQSSFSLGRRQKRAHPWPRGAFFAHYLMAGAARDRQTRPMPPGSWPGTFQGCSGRATGPLALGPGRAPVDQWARDPLILLALNDALNHLAAEYPD